MFINVVKKTVKTVLTFVGFVLCVRYSRHLTYGILMSLTFRLKISHEIVNFKKILLCRTWCIFIQNFSYLPA